MSNVKAAPEVKDKNGDLVDVADVLDYLDDLRESGATNMFGAGPYVQKKFGVGQKEAHSLLGYWMDTFGARQAIKNG